MINKKLTGEFSFSMPPKKAIEYFAKKQIMTAEQIDKIVAINKAKAFHMANINSLNILQAFKKELEKGLENGTTFSEFKKNIAEKITEQEFSKKRLNTIFRTNVNSAYQAGRFQALKENTDNRPFWQYQAILDDRVRDNHAGVHGKIFRHDDVFWTHFYPPNGYNCRCSVTALSDKDIRRKGLKVEKTEQGDFRKVPNNLKEPQNKSYIYKKRDSKGNLIASIKPDYGFDYPSQLFLYSPKLDYYDPELANIYVQRELNGATFAFVYKDIKERLAKIPELQGKDRFKFFNKHQVKIRNDLMIRANFAVGLIDDNIKTAFKSKSNTVLFSDNNLIKNIFKHDEMGILLYQVIPTLLKKIDLQKIVLEYINGNPHPTVKITHEDKKYNLGFKVVDEELFLLSIRLGE